VCADALPPLRHPSLTADPRRRPPGARIPLRDVIHFKERQWYLEELQNARDGDGMAMLRLAKMALHGQGCEANTLAAQARRAAPRRALPPCASRHT
jgi:hypothetical protein